MPGWGAVRGEQAPPTRKTIGARLASLPAGLYALTLLWVVWIPLFSLAYHHVEGWPYWEAFVFVATVVSTIGSGNTVPVTPAGRLLCILCGLVGIPLTLGSVVWVGHITIFIIEMQLKLFSKVFRK